MRLTIGNGKRTQEIVFATGSGWTKADTDTLLSVLKNATGFMPNAMTATGDPKVYPHGKPGSKAARSGQHLVHNTRNAHARA